MQKKTPGKHLTKRPMSGRVTAMCLTTTLLLAIILLPPGGTAQAAAPSLPYIETLRARMKSGSSFRILEILNEMDNTSGLGYYIPKNEPLRLEADPTFLAATNVAERSAAVTSWEAAATLLAGGLYGSNQDTHPLEISPYAEANYWESAATYPNILSLPAVEHKTVSGTRTDETNGAYKTTYAVTINQTDGNQILSGGHLVPAVEPGNTAPRYYYDINAVTFTQITTDTVFDSGLAGAAVYGKTAGNTYEFIGYYAPGIISPDHAETYNEGGIYLAAANQVPHSLTYVAGYYELIDAAAVTQPGGYLSRRVERLTLVESGGDCNFTAGSGESFEIYFNKIRYSGGFVNHNWFSRFVLDAEPADIPSIKYAMDTLHISAVGSFSLEQYASYDLIVVGEGVLTLPPNLITAIGGTAGATPIPSLFIAPLPAIVSNFSGAALNNTAGNGNFVFGSMYFYAPTTSALPGFDGFGSTSFTQNFVNSISGVASGLRPVLDDINYENELRVITGAPQLDKYVSIATTLRYILNQHQPRIVHPLSLVRILEVQPLNVTTNSRGMPGEKFLFASDNPVDSAAPRNVINWLRGLEITDASGAKHAVRAADVRITRMSTAEFNGKIENLNESYELIYIGDSRANFNLSAGQTVFPGDTNMNGLLYYNIGEPIVKTEGGSASYNPAGLLDSDWINSTTINKVTNTATLRLPGNDISDSKLLELEDYINAGYPVVFAEDLVSQYTGTLKGASYETTLTSAPTATDKVYTLTAATSYFAADGSSKNSIAELTSETTVQGVFEWHRVTEGGIDIIIRSFTRAEASDSYTVDVNASPGDYYCIYRLIQINPTGATSPLGTSARSNTIAANKDAVHIKIDGSPSNSASGTVHYTVTDGLSITLPTLTATAASGSTPAYITAEIPSGSHDALLGVYPDLRYIYTLEQYSAGGAEPMVVGDNTFIGSSSPDGNNTATTINTSAATTIPNYTFNLNPQADALYRVRIEIVGAPNITLSPAARVSGNTIYYDYYYVSFAESAPALIRPSNSDSGFALPKSISSPSGTARSARLTVSTAGTPLSMTSDKITLTASVNVTNISGNQTLTNKYIYAYQWERNGTAITGATATSYPVTAASENSGSYRCIVTATEIISGQASIVTGAALPLIAESKISGVFDSGSNPRPGAVNDYRPTTSFIDRWTNLFQFMLDAMVKNNVFSQSDISAVAEGKRPSLRSFLTLSKPSIVFTKNGSGIDNIPTPYANTGGSMSENISGRQLQYGFKISDPADPTPATTTYNVYLYIDSNASGKYTEDERFHIDVYTAGSQLITPYGSGYMLRADIEYHLEALLPSDIVGIIPWKLEIIKNSVDGNSAHYFHGSKIGYTRIKPTSAEDKHNISVLQIVGWDQYHQTGVSDRGTTVVLQTNKLYQELTSGLEDFNIRLNTIRNDGTCFQHQSSNGSYTGPVYRPESMESGRNDLWLGLNFNEGDKPTAEFNTAIQKIYTELMHYDMLVIGFADCYEGINDTLAHAILRYIESDKAVLFTHDTTSLNNIPYNAYMSNNIGGSAGAAGYWGYSFNQILRPAVGLDYYGIMDPAFRRDLASQTSTKKISSDTVNALKAAGYNIAYKPNSLIGELEEKTHGYNTYYFKKPDSGYRTKNITQVNAGQITTYPYNVNLAGFPNAPSGAAANLSVADTHFQYYALNMNSGDLVVWYALADDANLRNYSSTADTNGNYYHTNDAANGYYIYTMGNITYSGVGHHSGVTSDEAKLFVNTMIAAYRSSALNTEVTAKDKHNNDAHYLYYPANIFVGNQESMIANTTNPNNEMFAAYFSFIDASIKGGISSISHARYYYSIGATDLYGDPQRMIPITGVETYEGVGAASTRVPSVSRSRLYHFYIPNSVVNLLAEHNVLRVYFEVTTTYASGETGIGHDSIELRKIGLLPLQ